MKAVPVIKCRRMEVSLAFYTQLMGFIAESAPAPEATVVNVRRGEAELQLSIHAGDGEFGSAVNLIVHDVDVLFKEFIANGLDVTQRSESPVHTAPVNQTWGAREFYVDDPDGNTLRFVQPL